MDVVARVFMVTVLAISCTTFTPEASGSELYNNIVGGN
jgi:hypothetical protein